MLHIVADFLSRNILGMAIFAVITGVAGNFVYEHLKADQKPPTRSVDAPFPAPNLDTKVEAVIDAIIAELRRVQPAHPNDEVSRAVVRREIQAMKSALAVNPATSVLLDPITRSLSVGNLTSAEATLLASAAQAAKSRDHSALDTITSALASLYRIEGSTTKSEALQRLQFVAFSPPLRAATSAQSPTPQSSSNSSATPSASPMQSSQTSSTNQPAPQPTFSIQSQSRTEFEVSIPMERVVVSFGGTNLHLITKLSLQALPIEESSPCVPFSATRIPGTPEWQRNFAELTPESMTIAFIPVIFPDPKGNCRWLFHFSDQSGGTVTSSVVVRYVSK